MDTLSYLSAKQTNWTVQVRADCFFLFLDCVLEPLGLKSLSRSSRIASAEGLAPATLPPPAEVPALPSSESLQSSRNRTRSPIAVTPNRSICSSVIAKIVEGTILSLLNWAPNPSRWSSFKMSSILRLKRREEHSGFFPRLPPNCTAS